MDRNFKFRFHLFFGISVATREGGVDRNLYEFVALLVGNGSPPARVAWIETSCLLCCSLNIFRSPPARVAWIETRVKDALARRVKVATREGGVDRNTIV